MKHHIYQIIQDINGTSRAKKVQYLKNNSLLLYTGIHTYKMDSLNQLVEMYLQHNKEVTSTSPDIILPTNLSEGMPDWVAYPVRDFVKQTEYEEELAITEVLSDYDIVEKDGAPIKDLFYNEKSGFDRVILPTKKGMEFTVVKSCLVVHWKGQ